MPTLFARHAPLPESKPTRRVRRGCELLDRYRPAWAAEIDDDTLDVASSVWCPLGQLYGSYARGKMELAMISGVRYGFNLGLWTRLIHGPYSRRFHRELAELNAEWKTQITRRRVRATIDRMACRHAGKCSQN